MRTVLLVAAFVFTGCNQLFVEGHVSSLCQHVPAQTIKAAVLAKLVAAKSTVAKPIKFDLAVATPEELDRADVWVALSDVTLNAIEGTTFGFLDYANVTLEPPEQSILPARTLVELRREEIRPTKLHFAGDAFDLMPYLSADTLHFSIVFEGSAPETDLVVDIDACAEVAVRYDYAK